MASLSKDPVTALERDGLMVLLQHPDIVPLESSTPVLATLYSHGALALLQYALTSARDT